MTEDVVFSALTILVIDDQDFVRTIVRKMLEQLGVGRVIEARDGHSGLDSARADRPDLILCDIQMRPLDGFGFVEALRATPALADLPVILLTGHTDGATQNRAKELAVRALLAKPVLPPALRDKIRAALRPLPDD